MSRVTLTNPFDLLTDENEDRTNVPVPKQSKEQKPAAPAKPAPAKPAATGAAAAKPAAAKPAAPKPEGAKAPAKPADAKAAPKTQPAVAPASQAAKPAPPRDANQNLQERDKESRPPRDKRDRAPVAGGADRQKRTYDRKSGTGRPQNEVKKGGQGKGNWGGEVDAKEGAEALKDKEEKLDDKEEGEEAKGEEKPAAEGEEKKEGEVKDEKPVVPAAPEELTYDEYLAKLKQKAPPKVEAHKPRTVTADDFSAAGLVPLQRGEEVIPPLNPKDKKEKKEKAAGEKPEKSEGKKEGKKEKSLAAQLLTFSTHQDEKRKERFGSNPRPEYDNNRGSGGERRGGGRGGPPRGDRPPRSDNNNRGKPQAAAAGTQPLGDLQKDFPALGPHGSEQPAVKA